MFKPTQNLQKNNKNYCVSSAKGSLFIYLEPVFLWAFGESSGFLSDSSSELLLDEAEEDSSLAVDGGGGGAAAALESSSLSELSFELEELWSSFSCCCWEGGASVVLASLVIRLAKGLALPFMKRALIVDKFVT